MGGLSGTLLWGPILMDILDLCTTAHTFTVPVPFTDTSQERSKKQYLSKSTMKSSANDYI